VKLRDNTTLQLFLLKQSNGWSGQGTTGGNSMICRDGSILKLSGQAIG
jgi:hypothetical protein